MTYNGTDGRLEIWKNQAKNTWENFNRTNNSEKPFYKISVVDPPKKSLYFEGIRDNMEINVTVDAEAGKSHVFSIFTVLSTEDIMNERIVVGNGMSYNDKYYGFGWKGGKFCIWKGDDYIEIQNNIYPLKASAIELNKKNGFKCRMGFNITYSES